jgi:hypothetical protein
MLNVPVKLVSITAFQPLDLMSAAFEGNWPPPLLTRKLRPPKRSRVLDIVRLKMRKYETSVREH